MSEKVSGPDLPDPKNFDSAVAYAAALIAAGLDSGIAIKMAHAQSASFIRRNTLKSSGTINTNRDRSTGGNNPEGDADNR